MLKDGLLGDGALNDYYQGLVVRADSPTLHSFEAMARAFAGHNALDYFTSEAQIEAGLKMWELYHANDSLIATLLAKSVVGKESLSRNRYDPSLFKLSEERKRDDTDLDLGSKDRGKDYWDFGSKTNSFPKYFRENPITLEYDIEGASKDERSRITPPSKTFVGLEYLASVIALKPTPTLPEPFESIEAYIKTLSD